MYVVTKIIKIINVCDTETKNNKIISLVNIISDITEYGDRVKLFDSFIINYKYIEIKHKIITINFTYLIIKKSNIRIELFILIIEEEKFKCEGLYKSVHLKSEEYSLKNEYLKLITT
jgi:hypothetical protein